MRKLFDSQLSIFVDDVGFARHAPGVPRTCPANAGMRDELFLFKFLTSVGAQGLEPWTSSV